MAKQLLNLRIEKDKLDRLKSIAENKKCGYSDLIRGKVDEILNGHDEVTLNQVKGIVKELREPFVYFNTKVGRDWAKKQKESRERIATIIERCFGIERNNNRDGRSIKKEGD